MSPKATARKKPARAKSAARPAAKKTTRAAAPKQAQPENGSIVHVEFNTPDLEAAKKFYSEVFGWEFHPFQPTEMYFMTPKSWGPCGCMLQGQIGNQTTLIYVNTNDIEGLLSKGERLGAHTVKPRTEIPDGHGFFAHMRAPDGNVFGIYSRH